MKLFWKYGWCFFCLINAVIGFITPEGARLFNGMGWTLAGYLGLVMWAKELTTQKGEQ